MTDYATIEYLNLTLAHALLLDEKIGEPGGIIFSAGEFLRDGYNRLFAIDSDLAYLEKLLGIQ